jgi:hypothetical protein
MAIKDNVYTQGQNYMADLIDGKTIVEEFKGHALAGLKAGTAGDGAYGDPTGTAGDENILLTDKNYFEYHILGTQTLLAPVVDASGLDLQLDATANDGIELTAGILTSSKSTFTVGTDAAFEFSATVEIQDVSGTDDFVIGFRKLEAYQANVDDYDEMAAINVESGDIKLETILNGAATTTTDTTDNWADGESKVVTVKVDAAGKVTYAIDGAAPTTVAGFTFDDAEVVIPFIYALQDTDLTNIYVSKWECGLTVN